MQFATIFIFSWCLSYTEGKHEAVATGEKANLHGDLDILTELKELREKRREEVSFRVELQNQLQLQQEQIEDQRRRIETLQNGKVKRSKGPEVKRSSTTMPAEGQPLVEEPESRYTSVGCPAMNLTLSCPGTRKIQIKDAIYGEYGLACKDACCPPNHYQDCTMLVSHIEPKDWIGIKLKCDNRTSCWHIYNEVPIAACNAESGDYMQIYYECLPVDRDEPVGFTAHASVTKGYRFMETVVFDDIESNIGAYYNPMTSSFHCPHHGIYLFSVMFQTTQNKRMDLQLVKNDEVLAQSLAYYYGPGDIFVYNHAGSVVIVECGIGEVVWARSGSSSGTLYGTQKHSQFSGYLLHRFD